MTLQKRGKKIKKVEKGQRKRDKKKKYVSERKREREKKIGASG